MTFYFVYRYVHLFLLFFTEKCAMLTLRCLALLFASLKTKKLDESIPYIIKIVPVS